MQTKMSGFTYSKTRRTLTTLIPLGRRKRFFDNYYCECVSLNYRLRLGIRRVPYVPNRTTGLRNLSAGLDPRSETPSTDVF